MFNFGASSTSQQSSSIPTSFSFSDNKQQQQQQQQQNQTKPFTFSFGGIASNTSTQTQPTSSTSTTQQLQQQQNLNPSINLTTKFSDLPENAKKYLLEIESQISNQTKLKDEIQNNLIKNQMIPSNQLNESSKETLLSSTLLILDSIDEKIFDLKIEIEKHQFELHSIESKSKFENSEMNNLCNLWKSFSQQFQNITNNININGNNSDNNIGYTNISNDSISRIEGLYLPSQYQWIKLNFAKSRIDRLRSQIEELENLVDSKNFTLQSMPINSSLLSIQSISTILKNQHRTLIHLSAQTANLDNAIFNLKQNANQLKQNNLQYEQSQTNLVTKKLWVHEISSSSQFPNQIPKLNPMYG